jgi:hypothetical protein
MSQPNVPIAASSDRATAALARLVGVLAEDALFALAAGGDCADALEALAKRRHEAYAALPQGVPFARMTGAFEPWACELARALAPVAPPVWMPMMDVVRERVTLEGGPRGLRSLFSSKTSDKEASRITKIGTLAARVLRAVLAADGPLDPEESMLVSSFVAALGFPDVDAAKLRDEAPMPIEKVEIYGDLDPDTARAVVRGAWLAAAIDAIDPREEHVVRITGYKLGITNEQVESLRGEAQERVDARRLAGLAAIDGVRFVLSDRQPGAGVQLAALVARLMLPRRYRDEALAHVGHGAPVVLGKRYDALADPERVAVLGVAWAAALYEDPTLARRALLAARWERFADDIGGDGEAPRALVEGWMQSVLMTMARALK